MGRMGAHTALNGHRGEDGAATVTPFQPLDLTRFLPRGPVADLPRNGHDVHHNGSDSGQDGRVAAAAGAGVRIDGDRLRRGAMWIFASGVAAIAAVVSYSHIYDLGRAHGGSGTAARLLPLSVDMLIVVGELMLLHEADKKGRRFVLGWVLVWSGILATLAANVTYGYQYGIVGALIWGWPAYSFILAAGGMVAVVKRAATEDMDTAADTTADIGTDVQAAIEPAPVPDTAVDIQPDIPVVKDTDKPQAAARTVRRPVTGQEKATAILRRNPGLSNEEVAKRASVSAKTVQRARSELAKAES